MTDRSPLKAGKITILGAGSWGLTLSWLYGSAGKEIWLWTRDKTKAHTLSEKRIVDKPFSITLPAEVKITSDLRLAAQNAQIIIFCCPSQAMRSVAKGLAAILQSTEPMANKCQEIPQPVLISATKGLELSSLMRMSQVLTECMADKPVGCLSGPNLAFEVLRGLPTASVVAFPHLEIAHYVQERLTLPNFRLYTNHDLVGVELGGTLKNSIAIAAGCSDGLELGANAKAALLTRGLAEMTRFAVALGAKPLTLSGLSGMGDLIATCSSSLSRNYRLGYRMALGQTKEEILADLGGVAEGVPTNEAICELSQRLSIELPIAQQVEATLKGKTTPKGAIMALMKRPLASEHKDSEPADDK